jgi:hypothetical protein
VLITCLIVNLFNELIDYNRVIILSIYTCLASLRSGDSLDGCDHWLIDHVLDRLGDVGAL